MFGTVPYGLHVTTATVFGVVKVTPRRNVREQGQSLERGDFNIDETNLNKQTLNEMSF